MEPFIGQIMMFGGNFAPRGWAKCEGQLLDIASHSALFSILGTTYGGDGRSNFKLPDLRGRMPMHEGTGPGLTPRHLGDHGGEEDVQLTEQQMPAHSHQVVATSQPGGELSPVGNILAKGHTDDSSDLPVAEYQVMQDGAHEHMHPQAITSVGGGQPHDNMPPFTCVTFCIALEGLYPTRN